MFAIKTCLLMELADNQEDGEELKTIINELTELIKDNKRLQSLFNK